MLIPSADSSPFPASPLRLVASQHQAESATLKSCRPSMAYREVLEVKIKTKRSVANSQDEADNIIITQKQVAQGTSQIKK